MRVGVRGTNSRMQVVQADRSSAIQKKSSMALWKPLVRITLLPVTWQRDYCTLMNRLMTPIRMININHISLRTWCHVSILTRFWLGGMDSSIYFIWSKW